MKKLSFITLFSFAIIAGTAFSQAPVTFVKFYEDYQDLEEIQHIEKYGDLDGKVAPFLLDEANSIDEKAAVINSLAYKEKAGRFAEIFSMFLGRKYGVSYQDLDYNVFTGPELFCLGYLLIIDHGGDLEKAMKFLEMSKDKMMDSYTVNVIYALAQAQKFLNSNDECGAWRTFKDVNNDTRLSKDMSGNAVEIIADSMAKYNNKCD